jgi:hypothetical protein
MRVEDAMRLADTDDRLLLLRRLDLGRVPPNASSMQWAMRASERVQAQRTRSVHAMAPGASSADAVWFHSVDEAWMLLLLELAAGRVPTAWFWRLAVQDWNGAPLRVWLPRLIAEALWEPARDAALARTIVRAIAGGALEAIVAALAEAPLPVTLRPAKALAGHPIAGRTAKEHEIVAQVHRLLARLDPAVRGGMLRAIADGTAVGPAPVWLLRSAFVAAAPELLGAPDRSAALCEAAVEIARVPSANRQQPQEFSAADAPPQLRVPGADGRRQAPAPQPTAIEFPRETEAVASVPPAPVTAAGKEARTRAGQHAPAPEHTPATDASKELSSAAAGLFLLIRPLVLMGLPHWLDRDPDLAADGFARGLLCAIGHKYRAPADDPVFAVLDQRSSAILPDQPLTAWRVGLDRWLRRRARIKLAEVARTRGWISAAHDAITVRFRVEAAELRLWRLALDVDPGWVPFLGLAVRYHYRDTAIG